MGWATPIVAPEQVEYRLAEDCGCDQSSDAEVEYRLAAASDLRWIGSGLTELGLVAGEPVDPDAARALMDGRDWRTGERLVKRKRELDPRGKVTARVVVDAITELAAADGMTAAQYLGNEALASRFARAERGIVRDGEAHLLPVGDAGRLAAAAGLSVEQLYGGDVIAEANRWRNHRVDVGLRGVDLSLDLPKSISTAYALAGEELAAAIEGEWMASVTEAVGALEEWTAYGLAGHHGDGQRAERVATSGLIGWTTLHRSARPVDASPGDPHLHVHVNIAHMARCEDGKWRTIAAGAEDLLRHVHLINEIAEARLRARLIERHGARFARSESTGAWELVGVDGDLRSAFSRRRQQVLDLVGRDAGRDRMRAAARRTAQAKDEAAAEAPRHNWRTRAAAVLGGEAAVDAMVAAALPGPDGPDGPAPSWPGGDWPLMPGPQEIASQIWDPGHGLTAGRKAVTHTHVMAAVTRTLPYLLSKDQLVALTDEVLSVDGHAVRLADSNRHHRTHRQRYTHSGVVAAEQTIIECATAGLGAGLAQLTPEAAELTIATVEVAQSTSGRAFRFSPQQRAVVMRLLTAGHGADAVIGVAGAGKTTLMSAARAGWEAAGLTVAGASTAAVAAANLAAEAGIESRTIAAWTREISGGRGLDGVGVLVIDEAAMVDDRALATLLRHAARTGTKIAGVGDPLQLRAVGIGGGFARIHRLVDGLQLTENRRQGDVVERAALQDWRDGGRTTALSAYAAHGHVHADDTATEALTSMLARWNEVRGRWAGDPHGQVADLLLLAARRADVAALNAGARAVLVASGELDAGRTYAVAGGGRVAFAAGDLVHIRRNDYRSRRDLSQPDVLNGFRGVVLEVDDERGVRVEWCRRRPGGGHVTQTAWMSRKDIAEGRLTHGYAMTIGSAQGLTSDLTIAYGLHADSRSLYPAMSRARLESHLFLPLDELEDDVTRIRFGEVRTDGERLDRAVAACGRLLEAERGDVMVTDELTTAGRSMPTIPPAAVTPWNEREWGHLATAQLEPGVQQANRDAAIATERARTYARQAEELAAVLGTGQAPARRTFAQISRHLDTADSDLARAVRAEEQADAVDLQLARLRESNRIEGDAERKIVARLALKRTVLTGRRRMREAADVMHARIEDRTRQITELDDRAAELRARARALRDSVRDRIHRSTGTDSDRPLSDRITECRAQLPALAVRLSRADADRHEELLRQAAEQRTIAALETRKACGLRVEAELRARFTPGQAVRETEQRSLAAREAAAARQAGQNLRRATREAGHRNRAASPQPQGRPGPGLGR
ncbi:MobF family relaxase [Streptomyces atratus]|uniref:Conjugative relaxase domain-containing protein, TrwC/TraI family n=1 Tax=Streptomyces atratus TaxID=1893 RepID=A0A1K2F242_STRAR|nr:MobF family relaxase [Streptomyces atratus]SFY41795.1 conjugative relaxase domain-containing protein, TrwC/TraI family [Streptomyces atratus]